MSPLRSDSGPRVEHTPGGERQGRDGESRHRGTLPRGRRLQKERNAAAGRERHEHVGGQEEDVGISDVVGVGKERRDEPSRHDQHSHSRLPDETCQANQCGRHADPAELLDHIEPVQPQPRPQRRFVHAHDHRAAPVALRDVEPECLQGIGEAFGRDKARIHAAEIPPVLQGAQRRDRCGERHDPRSQERAGASRDGSSQEQRGCRQQQHHHQVIAEAECVDGKEHAQPRH